VQRGQDSDENAGFIRQHIVVAKPQDAITLCRQPGISLPIARIAGMLPTVDLDDELPLPADKITMYRPIASCRTNLNPSSRRSRTANQILVSASVGCCRKRRSVRTLL
jgi:hypothetical protein